MRISNARAPPSYARARTRSPARARRHRRHRRRRAGPAGRGRRRRPVPRSADPPPPRRVAEHALDRRALVGDLPAGTEHGDEVARVLDERAEARLAAPPVDLLGERDAVERERDLRGERPQRGLDRRGGPPGPGHTSRFGAPRRGVISTTAAQSGTGQRAARPSARHRPRPRAVRAARVADATEQRRRMIAGERSRRAHRDVVDLRAARRADQRCAGAESIRSRASERSCWRTRPGHAHDDEAEERDRRAVTTAMSRSPRWMSCTRLITARRATRT